MTSDFSLVPLYFPELTQEQLLKLSELKPLYTFWNQKINVISRKDIDQLFERHVVHSLAISKVIKFPAGTNVLDVGTGGGFPGIPLAIMFPDVKFHLVDSIGKKIKVVHEIATESKLENVRATKFRAEDIDEKFHFVVTRAVAPFPELYRWIGRKIIRGNTEGVTHGIVALKGGDLFDEIKAFEKIQEIDLKKFFKEEFFETKKIVYLPLA